MMPIQKLSNSTLILVLLIAGDLAFSVLHIIFEIPQYSDFPPIIDYLYYETFLLTVDGSFPEWYQYLKFGTLLVLLNRILKITREKNFVAWGCVFAYLLLDDALRIHEDLGGYVASFFNFTAPMGLRLKDIGEFAVLGGIGFLLLIALTVASASSHLSNSGKTKSFLARNCSNSSCAEPPSDRSSSA